VRILAKWALLGALCAVVTSVAAGAAAEEPYELNAILSINGSAAFLGHAESQSLGLIEQIVNRSGGIRGRPVHITIADDQSNPQITVQLTNALIAKNVPVMLGPSLTATCNAIAPLIRDHGPLDYCFSPGIHPTPTSNMLAAGVATIRSGGALAHYLRAHNLTRVALIASTDGSGQEGELALNEVFAEPENKSLQLVAVEHFNPSDFSVLAQVERIKAANPQAIYVSTAGTPFGTVLRSLTDAGLDVVVSAAASNLSTAQMSQYASLAVNKIYIPGPLFLGGDMIPPGPIRQAQQVFFAAQKSIGYQPDNASALGWDPTLIVVNALRTAGPDATSTQLRDAIQHMRGFVGIDGEYNYANGTNPWGLTEQAVVVTHWDPVHQTFRAVSKPGGA
jgi:branched-chain amino acid transport system substrate-binding protein